MFNEVLTIQVKDLFLIIAGVVIFLLLLARIGDYNRESKNKRHKNSGRVVKRYRMVDASINNRNNKKDGFDIDDFMEWDLMGLIDDEIDDLWG